MVRKNGKIMRFYGKGHAGYADYGNDIVCAAVSALTQHTAFGILSYLKIDADFSTKDGFLDLNLENCTLKEKERENADVLLETLFITLKSIEKEYSENFKLVEKEV